jgi:hypothetical protein
MLPVEAGSALPENVALDAKTITKKACGLNIIFISFPFPKITS